MGKRIIVLILFVPAMLIMWPEIIFYAFRWVLTGRSFPEGPVVFELLKWGGIE